MPPQQGPPQRVDNFWHFPEHDFIHHVHGRAYVMPEYDIKSLEEIENKLKAGHLNHDEVHTYHHFLEHMSTHVRDILQDEKAEGISNLELEKHYRKIVGLLNQLAGQH